VADLLLDGGCGLAFPVGGVFPGGDVAGFGLSGVVLVDAVDPCLPEELARFRWWVFRSVLLGCCGELLVEVTDAGLAAVGSYVVSQSCQFRIDVSGLVVCGQVE